MLLTAKQQNFLDYLERELARHGTVPSLRQAAKDLGVTHAAVAQLIRVLEKKEVLKREGRYSRELRLLPRSGHLAVGQRWREIPIVGKVTAGLPIYAQQEWAGTIVVDGQLYRGANLFALQVKGDSMKDAGILPGDLAICEPRQYARDGEIVVALLEGEEATVKRFFLLPEAIELRPANREYPVQRYDFGAILIQGKVIGVQRGPLQMEGGGGEFGPALAAGEGDFPLVNSG